MSYNTGGTGKGSAVRSGLDVNKYEENMEKLRKTKKVNSLVKEIIKSDTKTTYKY